ncbi:hypothetical protein B0T26DRAFT_751240 [Lasiosphaeria miniovina]|uniref:Uncharacterized protein n=1 Tax=Lasiosphaeria miniovina TaxID=1954250 RepID=A0AA40AJS9_9PEZI|nr:uncharacterized protein B0T26DRAFT_751240 [Lasiosphaeria miniovina]KAK0717146.1 hypothetical protein B0T26DRAFT_751240 [Lasiosphaeria miniovina]
MAALSFIDLARELRDMVYEYYVAIDGGYVFDPESDKLKAPSPRAHLFALQRTYKRVTDEITGLAFIHNLVTFSTILRMRDRAFLVEFLFDLYFNAVRLRLSDKYWNIPSDEELEKMPKALRPTEENRFLYHFSAAAAAIRFLRSNPSSRVHVRRILLDEDREAVAYPETHGKGLVPFCAENPHLRIERRVSL